MAAHKGYLLLADITGYTGFLAATSVEAGGDIASTLLGTLLEAVSPPFRVGNIEGDALFLYAEDDGAASGQTVLDAIDALYCAFTDRVCTLKYGAACPNDPRLLAGALDLKLLVHYGDYVIQEIGGRQELAGPDVILVHRMAKAEQPRQLGLTGYGLITTTAASQMQLDAFFEQMKTSVEKVEHLGAVESYIYPLASIWEHRRGSVRRFIDCDAALLIEQITVNLPVPPCRAWELITEPVYRAQWIAGVKNITVDNDDHGRVGEGAVQYCDHGEGMVVPVTVVDWHPFDYISYEIATPLGLVVQQTVELRPAGSGTQIAIRIARPSPKGLMDRWRIKKKIETLQGLFSEVYSQVTTVLPRLAQGTVAAQVTS